MIDQPSNKVLFIVGPTASGKTRLAIKLAKKLNGELISADSRQVYKGLDIVTGKDIPATKVHGYDLINPDQEWNAVLFQKFALKKIKDIHLRNKLPIIVGGTGLYINTLLNNFSTSTPPNQDLRKKLEKLTLEKLQQKLRILNKNRFDNLNNSDIKNPRRLIRAIEISSSGKSKKINNLQFDSLLIGLSLPLSILEQRIMVRVKKRLATNPQTELEYLKSFNLPWTGQSTSSLGYLELEKYYAQQINTEELINLWTIKERQYAKRQITWFKKQQNIHWFDVNDKNLDPKVVDLVSTWYIQR